jgi:hypothetical protein
LGYGCHACKNYHFRRNATLPAAVQGTIPTIFDFGITTALKLFVVGLKPAFVKKMMKGMLVLLWDAF